MVYHKAKAVSKLKTCIEKISFLAEEVPPFDNINDIGYVEYKDLHEKQKQWN